MYRCQHLQVFKIGIVIILSLSAFPHARASLRCPHKCKCSATSVTCMDKELIEVPDFKRITSKPTTIDLSENEIDEITNLSFNYKNLDALIILKLCNNIIFDIQVNAFLTLRKLKYLDVSNNLLEDFQEELILHNEELQELKLTGNLFGTKTPELKSNSLEILDLSYCKISTFTKSNVEGLPNLRLLYLQANSLTELDPKIFGIHFQYIDLSFNAWKCQCDTIKLFQSLTNANLTKISNPVQCIQSFRRYEDIFDFNGPVKFSKWCGTKTISTGSSSSTKTTTELTSTMKSTEDAGVDFKIWISVIVIASVLAIAIISFVFILRSQRRNNKTKQSRGTVYSELSTVNKILIQRNFSKANSKHETV